MRSTGALAVLIAAISSVALPAPSAAAPDDPRVLVISVPGLSWAGVQEHDLPNIEAFLEGAAMADLAPRGVSAQSTPGAAYLTLSAGSRATSDPLVDGQQLAVDQQSTGSTAGEIFERRTGTEPDGEFVALAWPTLLAANEQEPYGAELGLLAETLGDAGLGTVAIGNADGSDGLGVTFARQVGLAVAKADGVISDGELGDDLLLDEASLPFGVRLDLDEVMARFDTAWQAPAGRDGGVVLVEASDLARTMRYHDLVDEQRYADLFAEALADTDELVGRLMAEVDTDLDAVLLVAPYNLAEERDLTIAALSAPGQEAGYLRSASTQRSGFLTLVDIAPTVLDLLDVSRPVTMEGRPAEFVASDASLDERVDRLVTLNEQSRFRENLLFPTTLAVVIALAAVCAAAVVAVSRGGWPRFERVVVFAGLTLLSVLPMSFIVRAFPLEDLGLGFHWAFLVIGALCVAGLATAVSARLGRPQLALAGVLVVVLAVPLLDVMTGSNLSLSAAFGYSATGNSRLYGISNYAFGQVAAASCLLAGMLVPASPSPGRRLAAIGLLVGVLVVIGVPVWGSDVGGTLAFTPAILVFAALVYQRRIRLRTVVVAGLVTLAAVTAFGLLDLARPAGQRAHLGRLFERIGNEGLDPLLDLVERKALAMLSVTTSSFWVAAIPVAIAFIVFLARYPGRPLALVRQRFPMLQAGLVAAYVAAVLGTLANDSGAIIGGVTLTVLALSLAALALGSDVPARSGPAAQSVTDFTPTEERVRS